MSIICADDLRTKLEEKILNSDEFIQTYVTIARLLDDEINDNKGDYIWVSFKDTNNEVKSKIINNLGLKNYNIYKLRNFPDEYVIDFSTELSKNFDPLNNKFNLNNKIKHILNNLIDDKNKDRGEATTCPDNNLTNTFVNTTVEYNLLTYNQMQKMWWASVKCSPKYTPILKYVADSINNFIKNPTGILEFDFTPYDDKIITQVLTNEDYFVVNRDKFLLKVLSKDQNKHSGSKPYYVAICLDHKMEHPEQNLTIFNNYKMNNFTNSQITCSTKIICLKFDYESNPSFYEGTAWTDL